MAKNESGPKHESSIYSSLWRIENRIELIVAEQHQLIDVLTTLRPEVAVIRDKHSFPSAHNTSEAVAPREQLHNGTHEIQHQYVLDGCGESTEDKQLIELVRIASSRRNTFDDRWPVSLIRRSEFDACPAEVEFPSSMVTHPSLNAGIKEHRAHDDKAPHCLHRATMWPNSRLSNARDLLGMCVLAADLAFTPLQIAWNIAFEGWVYAFTVFIAFFWTVDLVLNFRTGYYTQTGDLETRATKIALHYAKRLFAIDFGLVTMDWLHIVFATQGLETRTTGFATIKLLRCLKVARFARILRVFHTQRFGILADFLDFVGVDDRVIECAKAATYFMLMTHIVCCAWFLAGRFGLSDTRMNWVVNTSLSSSASESYADVDMMYQYCSALQWSLATMVSGSSSIFPLNSLEQLFSCSCILVGLLAQAFFVSILSSAAVEQRQKQRSLSNAVSSLQKFCYRNNVPSQTYLLARSQIKQYFIQTSSAAITIKKIEGLQEVASKVRMAVLHAAIHPYLRRHTLFLLWSEFDNRRYSILTSKHMDVMYIQCGHEVFMAGDLASGMYLLSNGRATYSQDPGTSKLSDRLTVQVALDTWICEPALWMNWTHVGTMEADAVECEVWFVSLEGFLKLIPALSMNFRIIMTEYGRQYYELVRQSIPPHAPWPNDLETQGSNFVRILTIMHESARKVVGSLLLDFAFSVGAVGADQLALLEKEIEDGQAIFSLSQKGSIVSVERILSVARVFIRRPSDERSLVELGMMLDNEFVANCRWPGSTQRNSEGIWTTVSTVIDDLKHAVGEIIFLSAEEDSECKLSQKMGIHTKYHFFDVRYVRADASLSIAPSSASSGQGSNSGKHQNVFFPKYQSAGSSAGSVNFGRFQKHFFGSLRSADAENIRASLEERLLSRSDVHLIGQARQKVGMWLNEAERKFLQTREGAKFLENMFKDKALMPDPPRDASRRKGSGSEVGVEGFEQGLTRMAI